MKTDSATHRSTLRVLLVPASLLLIPALAMAVTDQVAWGPADFALVGTLLFGGTLAYEWTVRRPGDAAYRAGAGLALATVIFLVWSTLALGIVGSEAHPANAMYLAVLAVGLVGAGLARLRPRGMARALFATALAQAVATGIALALGLGGPASPPLEILMVNGLFIALWTGSALLFRQAARRAAAGGEG